MGLYICALRVVWTRKAPSWQIIGRNGLVARELVRLVREF